MFRRVVSLFLTLLSFSVLSQDLTVTAYKGITEFEQFRYFSEKITIKNEGLVEIPEAHSWCHAYLSSDSVLDDADDVLCSIQFTNPVAGQSLDITIAGSGPLVERGSYYLIVELDYLDEIKETNEENNIYVVPGITILPGNVDWSISEQLISASGKHPGDAIWLSYSILNSGGTPVHGWLNNNFYMSHDPSLDEKDILIGGSKLDFEGQSIQKDLVQKFFLPFADSGQYFIIGKTDDGNRYQEINESNNETVVGQITLREFIDTTFTKKVAVMPHESAKTLKSVPDTHANIGIGSGMNYGGIGAKTVIGYRNSGVLIGLGVIPGGVIGYEIGCQLSIRSVYLNLGYGVSGTYQMFNEGQKPVRAGNFLVGYMLNLTKEKDLFLDLGIGHTIDATTVPKDHGGLTYALGIGWRLSFN